MTNMTTSALYTQIYIQRKGHRLEINMYNKIANYQDWARAMSPSTGVSVATSFVSRAGSIH